MNRLNTPVAFLVFNRPETTRRVFAAIQAAQPARLLVIADGPRPGHPTDSRNCEEVRSIVSNVTWPCQIETNFAAENLGCRPRVISGLEWVFSLVEEAIILEDDCLPDPSFFPFCAELLARYRDDARIAMIAGTNPIDGEYSLPSSYYFSRISHIWGWATWRSAWARYDQYLEAWPELKASNLLAQIFDDKVTVRYFSAIFDAMHAGTGPNTWDYQWFYTNLFQNSLAIVPKKNLVTNIGFGPDSTHTTSNKYELSFPSSNMSFPLQHPPAVVPITSLDRLDVMRIYFPSPSIRLYYSAPPLVQRLIALIHAIRSRN